jgi:type II secretory pathway pseudopilin PulG
MPDWIAKYWVEWIFGIVAGVLVWLYRSVANSVKQEKQEQEAIKAGLQALLRAQMVNDFNKYSEQGYAPLYAKDNFENCWKQYERLGGNGVMHDVHKRFMELPTRG